MIASRSPDYDQVLDELARVPVMPPEHLSLGPMQEALSELELKLDRNKIIVIAGTNGKGTVAATLAHLLLHTEKSVGLFTSPHLVDIRERIQINGNMISKDDFASSYNAASKTKHFSTLTHFARLTLLAVHYFAQKNLDYIIFEIGMGGTYDPVNAIPHTTSVITTLGLDHQDTLGKDLESIAKNKFGIVSPHNLVVHAPLVRELEELRLKTERETNSKWVSTMEFDFTWTGDANPLPRTVLRTTFGQTTLALLGRRAAENSALALTVYQELGFDPTHALPHLATVIWPGRMQKIGDTPCATYLSGDHNLQGIESLLEILQHAKYKTLHLLFAASKGKDAKTMLRALANIPNVQIYLTQTRFKPSLPHPGHNSWPCFGTAALALLEIRQKAKPDDLIVATGSLYLVGELLGL